jgi:hypothetical protein
MEKSVEERVRSILLYIHEVLPNAVYLASELMLPESLAAS